MRKLLTVSREKDSVKILIDGKAIFLNWEDALNLASEISTYAFDVEGIKEKYSRLGPIDYEGEDEAFTIYEDSENEN